MRINKRNLILATVILVKFGSFSGVFGQAKSANSQIKLATDSIQETLNTSKSLQSFTATINAKLENPDKQLVSIQNQILYYKTTLKTIKTKEEFEKTIPQIARICDTLKIYDDQMATRSLAIKYELNLHLSKFRKALDNIVLLYIGKAEKDMLGNTRFIKLEDKNLEGYYLNLLNYHNNWKKNYEFK